MIQRQAFWRIILVEEGPSRICRLGEADRGSAGASCSGRCSAIRQI
jgi:hypothetical protein